MRKDVTRGLSLFVLAVGCCLHGVPNAAGAAEETALRSQLVAFLESGKAIGELPGDHPLRALARYPVAATTAYLLFEENPELLRKYYPSVTRLALERFADENLTENGLLASGAPSGGATAPLSPGLSALAAADLYSLHLMAWRSGNYEDALDFLAWSKRLSGTVTATFFDPQAAAFYPVDADGKRIPNLTPSALLPLVTDDLLGARRTAQVIDTFAARAPGLSETRALRGDPWNDPLVRPVILDLLSGVIPPGSAHFAALADAAARGGRETAPAQAVWMDFWRGNPALRMGLFPGWRTISTLTNLTLLLEHEALVVPKEMAPLRAGVDSLATALSARSMTLDSYASAMATANGIILRASRIRELIPSRKESWRVIDPIKWRQLSPRARRLVQEGLLSSVDDVKSAKVELSEKLGRSAGVVLSVELPRAPVPLGSEIEFTARLESARDTLELSDATIQIDERRWDMIALGRAARLVPGGPPVSYRGSFALPPGAEPGVVPLHILADLLSQGRRIELHGSESVALAPEYDVSFELPAGRLIGETPAPIDIEVHLAPRYDVRGTVEGTFLRELGTAPALPAAFLFKAGSESTKLSLRVSPKTRLAPGRYPFSLTVSLDNRTLAAYEDHLVKPFKWLHLGPLDGLGKRGTGALEYQVDLFASHTLPDGRSVRWQEVPPGAVDAEGALRPQRLYGRTENQCFLLYTVVSAPSRMSLVWKLSTKNTVSLWVNSAALIPETVPRENEMSGPIELRKGTNSLLLAITSDGPPDRISFALGDENGLPATSLNNDIEEIIDGYERLLHPEEPKQVEAPPENRLKQVTLSLERTDAHEVSVIGSFNNWEAGKTILRRTAPGKWTVSLLLAPGRYSYKFLIDRKTKIVDPANSVTEPDGFGGSNSVLEVR